MITVVMSEIIELNKNIYILCESRLKQNNFGKSRYAN